MILKKVECIALGVTEKSGIDKKTGESYQWCALSVVLSDEVESRKIYLDLEDRILLNKVKQFCSSWGAKVLLDIDLSATGKVRILDVDIEVS